MRKLLKNIIPTQWQHYYRKWRYSIPDNAPAEPRLKEKFTTIYQTNHWQSEQSISGRGSELEQTQTLIDELEKFFKTYKVQSVLDIPCGDFHWMQHVGLSGIHYVGADIVEGLIAKNNEQYQQSESIEFQVLDLTKDPLPKVDLVICRDCFIHLSYPHIRQAIANLKKSGSKYLLTTTYTNYSLNYNVSSGSWRPLNLQKPPFNFSEPEVIMNENCSEEGNLYQDKSLALWEIEDISF